MSLAALLDRYAPDAPIEERRALFEAIASHLPAPEFLWYEVAIQALHQEGDELKPLVLALLAHAPRSWHQVLMTALTAPEPAVQGAALAALYAQAQAEPERQEAFRALGDLPGWRLEALERWAELAESFAPAQPDPELERLLAENHHLEARVLDLEEENLMLREDRSRLGAAFEAENARAQRLVIELDDLKARHEALHVELLAQAERFQQDREDLQHNNHLVVVGLQDDISRAQLRHRRTLAAGLMAVVAMVVVGGPIGYSLVDRSSVMAMSPEELAVHAPRPISAKPDQSYKKILAQLQDEAEALEGEGRNDQALAVWQAAVRVAPSEDAAAPAQRGAQRLLERMRAGAAAKGALKPGSARPGAGLAANAKPGAAQAANGAKPGAGARAASSGRPAAAKAPHVAVHPNTSQGGVARVPAQPAPLPQGATFQAPAADPIPADVREKF